MKPLLQRAGLLATVAFVMAIPVALVVTNARWAINEMRLYQDGFRRYDISRKTGISFEDLSQVGRSIIRYFNSPQEPLQVTVSVGGVQRELFNAKEVSHMADVKRLVRRVYGIQYWALAYIALYILVRALRSRGGVLQSLASQVLVGSLLTVALLVILSLAVLLAFDRLFYFFHLVSFNNFLWMLDPSQDYLIMIFPQGFFFEATMVIALAVAIEGALLGIGSGLILVPGKKLPRLPSLPSLRGRRAPKKVSKGRR